MTVEGASPPANDQPTREDTPAAPAPVGDAAATAPVTEPIPGPDPWAHRRAEPRTFAFIWTMYLFAATVTTYAVAMSSGIGGHDVVRPAARMLLALVAAGLLIIWPLVRLSQAPDPRPIAGPILDIVVILVPIQAIVWPQAAWWLAGWPLPVVCAVTAAFTSWVLIIGALVSLTHSMRPRRALSPAAWMALFIAFAGIIHLPVMLTADPRSTSVTRLVSPAWMTSPVTAIFELTQDRTWIGTPAAVFGGHWRLIALASGVALGLWLVAAGVRTRRKNDPGLT